MKQPDTAFCNNQAFIEGWVLWDDGELQMLDEADVFASDKDAVAFVRSKAASGSAYHQQALQLYTETVRV